MIVHNFDWKDPNLFKDPGSKIDFHWWSTSTPTSYHQHNYYELFLITKGKTTHIVQERAEELKVGSFCLIGPDIPHQLLPAKNCVNEHFNVSITTDLFSNLCSIISDDLQYRIEKANNIFCSKITDDEFQSLSYHARHLTSKSSENLALNASLCKTLAINMLSILNIASSSINSYPAWFHDLLMKINSPDFIQNKASDIYAISNYSPSTLIAYFKQYLGCTIVDYFTSVKIKYACGLLKNTNFSTLQICSAIGYDSLSHFNRVFKTQMGMTPREYRSL